MTKNGKSLKRKKAYKILYVGNFEKVSVGEPEVARALERMGHKVTTVQQELTRTETLKELVNDYDFVLFAKLNIKNANIFIKECKIPTVCWLWDLYWGIPTRTRGIKSRQFPYFLADVVITSDGGNDDRWKDVGIKHHTLRQGVERDEIYLSENKTATNAEIGFIGYVSAGFYLPRKRLVDHLQEKYDTFQHFGQKGNIRHEELNDLVASLKIVIGDSYLSNNYWSNRVYEMLGRGAFMIINKIPGMDKHYTPYKHYIPYSNNNFNDLDDKIEYFLKHEDQRNEIRHNAMKHSKKYHTYDHRVKKFIDIIEKELCE